jgi:hypothetical protein
MRASHASTYFIDFSMKDDKQKQKQIYFSLFEKFVRLNDRIIEIHSPNVIVPES